MERSRFRGAAGEDEGAQWFELRVGGIDGPLELGDACHVETRLRELLAHLRAVGSCENRPDAEEVALDGAEHIVDARGWRDGAGESDGRIQLINFAVRIHAHGVLGDASAAEQPRVTCITGAGIDPKCHRAIFGGMNHEIKDVTIIGGGPTGIFASFYAGMRGVTSQIVDALPQLGGQLTALYPEKYIFDVAGFPQILAKDLVKQLVDQASRFSPPSHLLQKVVGLEEDDGHLVLVTETDRFPTRSVIVAAGIGAFAPRRLPQACAQPWYGKGVFDVVMDPEEYRGKHVLIIGGGDTAFDWGTQLIGRAAHVTLVHRSDRFRAHGATIAEYNAAVAAGKASMHTFHELADLTCTPDRFTHAILKDIKAKTTREIEVDVILPMLGFVSDIGALAEWGLTLQKDEIVVTGTTMETGRAGIWAAGDITTYPGKLKLIASGFAEAATAVNQAVHWIYPEKKVAPGHSSNMAVFGQKDD